MKKVSMCRTGYPKYYRWLQFVPIAIAVFVLWGCRDNTSPLSENIADGLRYTVYPYPEGLSRIHALEADLKRVDLRTLKAGRFLRDTGPLDEMVHAINDSLPVLAAVNGDFFSQEGLSSGAQIINGQILKDAAHGWWAFAIMKDQKACIAEYRLEALVIMPEDTLRIIRFNRPRGGGETVLYNRWYGTSTGTNSYGDELVLRVSETTVGEPFRAEIIRIDSNRGNHLLSDSTLVISTHGNGMRKRLRSLQSGSWVTLLFHTKPDSGVVKELIGGFPPLITQGQIHPMTRGRSEFYRKRFARTAIGILRNGNILIVCAEGDQTGNRGMTIRELADFMLRLGCRSALNLDGGGSSTFSLRGQILYPSSETAFERAITNAIVITERKNSSRPNLP